MIYDVRTYTCRPGTIGKHLALYAQHGYPTQSRHLGEPLAYMTAETGPLNSYTHIWAFDDAADRAARRKAMQADPEWKAYLARSAEAGYLVSQENRLMTPVDFAPVKR